MAKFKCPNCAAIIEVTNDMPVAVCPGCGKKYKNPKYEAPAAHPQAQEQYAQSAIGEQANEQKPETSLVKAAPAMTPAPAPEAAPAETPAKESKFTGTMISWLGHNLFNFFLTVITIGFAYPWVVCRRYRWEISHKIIDGHKLTFEGKGGSLLGHWLLWMLLTIITIGIYGLWVPCKLQAWITERTHIEEAAA